MSGHLEKWIIYWLSRGGEAGREKAFDRIWRLYYKRILYFVRQRHPSEAEDLAQEIFIKVYRNLDRFDPSRPFVTWIFTIARNHCINRAALKKPEIRSSCLHENGGGRFVDPVTPESMLLESERDRIIGEALAALDPDSREMAFLRYFEGMKNRRIGEILDVAEGTVKSRLFAIRGVLKEALADHEH